MPIDGLTMLYFKTSKTRKCHNQRPQTNPKHGEEEAQNTDSHMIARAQLK